MDQVCIIPCPTGAYCVRDKLVNAKKQSPQLCRESGKCCSPSQSIPIFDPRTPSKYVCPGAQLPVPCPQGNFCPNVTVQKTCPGGYFCRKGSVEPQNCPILSICKKGSSAPVSAPGGVLLIFGILLVMLLLLYCFHHEEKLVELFERYVTKKHYVRMEERSTLDKYREESEPKTQTITIRFENLSLSLKKKRAGGLFINDNFVRDLGVFRNITGFVPQEDIMHRTLTVKEVLIYQANLRLPSSISKEEKKRKVNEVCRKSPS
ncbi:ABC transporter G family member 28 [Stylophora pistillata]|uniref:ABC transporter G family member 28 n=1 Tax=Stylophora pistillata TaxID=50429 RepID=A0A2B4RFC4_STYPI|nr:ABC transporter G family member 28 [Stylophora pistillata]